MTLPARVSWGQKAAGSVSNWQHCTAVGYLLTPLLLLLLHPHTPGDDNEGSGNGSGHGKGKDYNKKHHHYGKDKECKKVCPAGPQVREGHSAVTDAQMGAVGQAAARRAHGSPPVQGGNACLILLLLLLLCFL